MIKVLFLETLWKKKIGFFLEKLEFFLKNFIFLFLSLSLLNFYLKK